jgi:hypothetical protein
MQQYEYALAQLQNAKPNTIINAFDSKYRIQQFQNAYPKGMYEIIDAHTDLGVELAVCGSEYESE